MHELAPGHNLDLRFTQVAESNKAQMALSGVDLTRHRYPFSLLFKGSYSAIPQLKLIATLFKRVLNSDADLLLLPGFSEIAHWSMLAAAIISGKKRAVFCDATLYDRRQSRLKGLLKRIFFRSCHGYFTYGERGKAYLLHYGAPANLIFKRVQAAALPNNYSPDSVLSRRIAARRNLEAPIFLYVGRLSSEKSIDVLLAAFAIFLSTARKAQLYIIGSGPLRDELTRLAANLNLLGSVSFVGSRDLDELSQEYLRADCLILPSQSEPWGLVANEALHFGCPVVVSENCGCVPELVISGVTGYTFRAGDARELADRMSNVIDNFKNTEHTGIRCLETISSFNPRTAATQTLAGCRALLNMLP